MRNLHFLDHFCLFNQIKFSLKWCKQCQCQFSVQHALISLKRKNFQCANSHEPQLRHIPTSLFPSIKMKWFQISRRSIRIRFPFKYSTIPLWNFINFPTASKTKTANMKISSIGHHRHRRICLRVFVNIFISACAALRYSRLFFIA